MDELDALLIDGIEDDMLYTDGARTMLIKHIVTGRPNFATGVAPTVIEETPVENCILHAQYQRNNQSIKQVNQRLEAMQNDSMNTNDTSIEVPKKEGLIISVGDMIVDELTQLQYVVQSVDTVTLRTRYSLGCRSLK